MISPAAMDADRLGLTIADLRLCRAAGLDPRRIAALRRADVITPPTNGDTVSDDPPNLSADELEAARLAGMSPERYRAIRDAPRQGLGGRSVADVQAALAASEHPDKEANR